MKRFWKAVTVERAEAEAEREGWQVRLDGRPVRTPARAPLAVASEPLARAIAAEWEACGETVDPRAMPLTGLANAAIDRVAPDPAAFAQSLARYAASDLLCYRAEHPPKLVEAQAAQWDPLLAWARRRYDVDFAVTAGVAPVDQPPATIDRLAHTVAALPPFTLAGLSPLVTIGGSLVAGLAVLEGAVTAEAGWAAVSLDERWQLEQWGFDEEAVRALALREADWRAATRFLSLLDAAA